jgi:hypothetical protein
MIKKPNIQLKKSNSKITLERVAKYSVLAGASLSTMVACDQEEQEIVSKIKYTNLRPDIYLMPRANDNFYFPLFDLTEKIDLNDDGIDEVTFNMATYRMIIYSGSPSDPFPSGDFFYKSNISMKAANGTKLLSRFEGLPDGYDNFITRNADNYVIVGLNQEAVVNGTLSIWRDSAQLALYYYNDYISEPKKLQFGDFLGQEHFVGVQFPIDGRNHYGWIRVQVANDGTSLKIRDYAYHIEPETIIKAGEQ